MPSETMSDKAVPRSQVPTAADVDGVPDEDPHLANFTAARILSDTIRSTLGPKGLDKLLVSSDGKLIVTNDGASILDRMEIDHPAARMLVEVAEEQDARAGDGTTTAVVIAGELLRTATDLLEKGFHPTTIIKGYHAATEQALQILTEQITDSAFDDSTLRALARTAVNGKWDEDGRAFLARRAVEVARFAEDDGVVDFERITRKAITGGSYYDTEVIDGLVINTDTSSTEVVSPGPNLPRTFDDATVALVDSELTIETASGQGTVTIDSPAQRADFDSFEKSIYRDHARRIVDSGADVVFCQKAIDKPIRYLLAGEGVLAVERTRRDELQKLQRVTGASAVPDTDRLTPADTGTADRIERRTIGDTDLAVVSNESETTHTSLLLRGGTERVVEETKRVLDDCFYVLKLALRDEAIVPGGGAAETAVAHGLRQHARHIPDRKQIVVEAYADAIEVVPQTLATTGGYDPVDTLLALRTAHHDGDTTTGIDLDTGDPTDMLAAGVVEPFAVKRRILTSATEAANLLIRVDDVVPAATDEAEEEDHDHGPGELVAQDEGYPWAIGHSMGH